MGGYFRVEAANSTKGREVHRCRYSLESATGGWNAGLSRSVQGEDDGLKRAWRVKSLGKRAR